ncbi:flagellar biosynthetic protein FlhB [Paraglaciecola sp. T6c]|uniref:flagellar biosynthesis protein FlhB n=1 Tax=Pseudoalteromonas atlantica (strain T6c / ATCC BAA-1087) TaxID=3042615 RepID=UPI00005C7340|nr:flagellar biosynthesis protein FlhB [Paraglaciecola sp. T6c]ABG41540.1 flagellar biosynthetic protein FlhB [Paraglaciecola sp. T6c]
MSDANEKTEDPTSKKITDSRKKGQVARSKELSTALVLVFSAAAFIMMGGQIAKAIYLVTQRTFTLSRDETYDFTHMFQAWGSAIETVATPVMLYMVIITAAGIYGNIALGGYNFTWQGAAPKANKLNPLAGFKRMFGMNGLVELLKAIAKVIVVMGMAYVAMLVFKDEALHLDLELYPQNLFHAMDLISWAFLMMCCALIPIAAFDVPYQSYKHNKEMKMSKQEVKDENKNAEGDPQVKNRIRRLQFQAAANRMMQEVPTADVVVTNPTHYSIALKYDQQGTRAPVLVAKGVDEMAMHIRKIADAHEVPIVASPMLARAIYYSTEVESEIPAKLFMAVAQILAYVFQLKAYKNGKGKRPKSVPTNLPIPYELRR